MRSVVFRLGFNEFIKLLLWIFTQGYRSVVVFRTPGRFVYVGSEGEPVFLFEVEEPEMCVGSDYYVFTKENGGVSWTCGFGMPSAEVLEKNNVVFVLELENDPFAEWGEPVG